MTRKAKQTRRYTPAELYNPTIDLSRDACIYARQSDKHQVVTNIQSHISQTVGMLNYARELGFRDDGSTGKVHLFVENEVIDADGQRSIKNASGTWPIDHRPALKKICDWIGEGRIGVVLTWSVDRLFRDEDGIDSNIFVKLCKENNCLVHIASKRMTYNFWNDQHVTLFRFEVQMAAWYISNYVKLTLLKRREMLAKEGKWVGGSTPIGYMICKDKTSPFYRKLIPYEPHAQVVRWLFQRFVTLGYDFAALCKEVQSMGVVFPKLPPETGGAIMNFQLTPSLDGYRISRHALYRLLTNEVYIGTFRFRSVEEDIVIQNNHPPIVSAEVFWSVYDHLRDERPDGTPTGRDRLIRYSQKKTPPEMRKPLLRPRSENGAVRWGYMTFGTASEEPRGWFYHVVQTRPLGLETESIFSIAADTLEGAVVIRLLERLREINIESIAEEKQIMQSSIRRSISSLERELHVIEERISSILENMQYLQVPDVIRELEASMARCLARRDQVKDQLAQLRERLASNALGTVEEELEELRELWPLKPFQERKALLNLLIKQLWVNYLTPHFYEVRIEWAYDSWGKEKAILYRKFGGSKDWTEEELTLLEELYPCAPKMEVLKALPRRTWRTISVIAHTKGIRRNRRMHESSEEDRCYGDGLCYDDIQFLKSSGLSLADFQEHSYNSKVFKQTPWTG